MRIAYANAPYRNDSVRGGNAHIGQFINNAVALGQEIWSWPENQHPAVHEIPTSVISRFRSMRKMDVLYVRVEHTPPSFCRWAIPPYRQLYGFPVVVWEFNTIPEFGLFRAQSKTDVEKTIQAFNYYGRGCDLAICMTRTLAEYVQNELGIQRVLIVPNGSDPDLFRPDAPPVRRITQDSTHLNVVWIGSAYLEYNNFDLLRETAFLLWERRYDQDQQIVFHIIGSDLIGKMGDMPPNVNYYGGEYYEALPSWLAAMDVGLCLYRHGPADHATPLKLFDYMASGLAVISTEIPFVCELFNRMGQIDLLVSSDDPLDLADKLSGLASDRKRVHRQGQIGRELVVNHYNWRRAVQDTMNEIEIILQERKRENRK